MSRLRDPRSVDRLVAAIFLVLGLLDVTIGPDVEGPLWGNVLATFGVAAVLLARRVAPVLAALAFYAILFAFAIWLTPPPDLLVAFGGFFFFPYAAAVYAGTRAAIVVLGGIPVTVVGVDMIVDQENIVADAFFPTVLGIAAFIVGRAVRSRLELAAELHEAALLAQEDEEAEAARAVHQERQRIAREMHDVVAHSISVMVVQAGGARRILETDPPRAADAAAEIERVGRDALLEMRRLLGALNPREGGPKMAPQPGMHDLGALLDRARAAGLPVDLHEQGERRTLAPGIDLALYRILQEALTNSLKHSGPAHTDVHLSWLEDCVEVEISDDGPSGNGFVDGQGFIGMRERVRLYGGQLDTARRQEGGFRVRARIPFMSKETV
jgi:signal transduction histidine kinase